MNNKRKALVTGGGGYIGSAVVRHLLIKNFEVYVLDNLSLGADGVSCFLGYPSYHFIQGNINDKKAIIVVNTVYKIGQNILLVVKLINS